MQIFNWKKIQYTSKTPIFIKAMPNLVSDPSGNSYHQLCEYEVIEYKPWYTNLDNWFVLAKNTLDCQF